MTKNEVVKVNGTTVECPFVNEQHYVAIRPICTALGIDYRKQFERIRKDEMLGQLVTDTVTSSDAGGKKRAMFCLPVKYIFSWLFSIEGEKVNAKSKPAFLRYKKECYDALYEHFYLRTALYERRERLIAEKKNEILQAEADKQYHAEIVKKLKAELVNIQEMPVMQFKIEFPQTAA